MVTFESAIEPDDRETIIRLWARTLCGAWVFREEASGKAYGRYRRPPCELVTNCDQFLVSPSRSVLSEVCNRFTLSDESTADLVLEVAICDFKLLNSRSKTGSSARQRAFAFT